MSSAMQCHVILDEAKNQDKVDNERLGELLLLKFDHSKFFSRFLLGKVKYCSFGISFDVNPSFDFEKYCQHFSQKQCGNLIFFCLSNFPSNQFWPVNTVNTFKKLTNLSKISQNGNRFHVKSEWEKNSLISTLWLATFFYFSRLFRLPPPQEYQFWSLELLKNNLLRFSVKTGNWNFRFSKRPLFEKKIMTLQIKPINILFPIMSG